MSGDPPDRKPRRRRLLSDDDAEVWAFVTRSIGPAKGKSRVRDVEPDKDAAFVRHDRPVDHAPKATPAPSRERSRVTRAPALSPPARAEVARRNLPEPTAKPLERRKARRLARGAEEIEARLDLHGMTQEDAHWALVGFIRRCHASGLRTVLVITGKGGPQTRAHHHDEVHERPRGVLRRNVPRWLAGAEIGALVVSFSTAHARHGGEGALYVRVRRKA